MRATVYNTQMLETMIQDMRKGLEQFKALNISYEKAKKEKTIAQLGFVFGALIKQITNFFLDCGFNVDESDVRYKLYDDVSKIVPEMVVDKQLFGGKPRIKHITEMDRALLSKFIDGIFTVLDQEPLYAGVKLSPDIYMNFIYHLDPVEVKQAQTMDLPERDEGYLNHIRKLPCVCCGIQHRSHAHHAKIPRYVSNSKKTPDWCAIPLCENCHLNGAHNKGHEWLLEQLSWLKYDLETVCRIMYLRWKNGVKR